MKFKNNASSKLATSLTAEATTLEVIAGTGSNFPTIVSPKEYFHATLVGDNGDMEIIRVTNISGDTFTVVRAQEDTVAKEWPAGTRLENRITAEFLNQVATGDTIKFDQVTIKTDSEGVSSVDPAEVYPPASSTELGVVKVDEETITISEDNAISVLPSGIIDNSTIVLDENGKLASKSITFDNGDIFDIYLKPGVSSLPSVSTPSGDGLATSIVPDLSSSDIVGTFYEGKSFGHVNGTKFVFDTDGFYIVSIRWIIQPLPEHQDADNILELMQEKSDGSIAEMATTDFELDLSNNLGAHATLTYPIWGKTGESVYSLLYTPSNSGTNKTSTVSWNMRIMRLPVTNEYQISDSEINDYYVGGHSGSVLVQVYEGQDSTYDVGEFQDIDFKYSGRKFTEKLSDGTVKILEDGLYFFQLEVAVDTSSDTGAVPYDYQIGIQAKMQSLPSEEWAKLCTNTISVESQILNPDVSQSSIVRRLSAGYIIRPYIHSGVTLTFSIYHSDLQIVKFPSLADASTILPFTAPTADAPGKEGLVPQPQATDPSEQLANILTMSGWAGFDPAAIMPSIAGDGSNILGLGAESAEGVNIDTLLRTGFFAAASFGGTLPPNTAGGVLINLFAAASGLYHGEQILVPLYGNIWYRFNSGGIPAGGTPSWTAWQAVGAPKPQAADGVGQFIQLWNTTSVFTLPDKGVWVYFTIEIVPSTGIVKQSVSSIAAGGTVLTAASGALMNGWAWRIA